MDVSPFSGKKPTVSQAENVTELMWKLGRRERAYEHDLYRVLHLCA